MITVFWDYGGVILVDVKLKATTINPNAYISKLKSSGSVSNVFSLTRIWQKCCFSMIMQDHTQV
jgi:hypothetical protein